MASLGPHTVSVVNPGTKASEYGNATQDDWAAAVTTIVPGCSVQPFKAPEFTVDRDNTTTRWLAWMPPQTVISSHSRVVWRGDTYDVDGNPELWDFAPLSHIVVNLRRSAG